MSQKIYPESVTLKKGLLIVVIIGVALIMGLIIWNIHHATHSQMTAQAVTPKIESVANASDIRWYQEGRVKLIKPSHRAPISPPKRQPTSLSKAQLKNESLSPEKIEEDMQKAMSAPIGTNQLIAEQPSLLQNNPSAIPEDLRGQLHRDQNMQGEKAAFLQSTSGDDYLNSTLQNPLTPYVLQVGSIIPGVMISGINSDLPGQISGQVRSNVYDSISGRFVLIPQASKIHGRYDAQIAYGQERVLVVWDRIVFPNGQSINLQGMAGVDMSGYGGFHDEVNNHYGKMFGSVILMSALGAGAQLAQPQQNSNNPWAAPSVGQTIAQSVGNNLANTGTMMTAKNLNIPPTLGIGPGYKFNIQVKKDIAFPGAYHGD